MGVTGLTVDGRRQKGNLCEALLSAVDAAHHCLMKPCLAWLGSSNQTPTTAPDALMSLTMVPSDLKGVWGAFGLSMTTKVALGVRI